MRRWLTVGIVTGLLGWAVAAPGAGAQSTGPQCGDLITTSVVLTEDLNCSGNGLEIDPSVQASAGDVTIDLNGHRIQGSGTGTGIHAHILDETFAGTLTITNGTVRGFQVGVDLHDLFPPVQVTKLVVTDNDTGVFFHDPGFARLANSTIAKNHGAGVLVVAADTDFEMVDDQVRDNGGAGITTAGEDNFRRLQDSFIAHNGGAGAQIEDSPAIISGNTFLGNAGTGLAIREREPALAPFYFVAANLAVGNGSGGMSVTGPGSGDFPPVPGTGNAAQHNAVFDCIVIVCAKNRGQARLQDAPSIALMPRHDQLRSG